MTKQTPDKGNARTSSVDGTGIEHLDKHFYMEFSCLLLFFIGVIFVLFAIRLIIDKRFLISFVSIFVSVGFSFVGKLIWSELDRQVAPTFSDKIYFYVPYGAVLLTIIGFTSAVLFHDVM